MKRKAKHLISERLNCKLLKAGRVCGQYLLVLFLWNSVGANGVMGDNWKSCLALSSILAQHGSPQVSVSEISTCEVCSRISGDGLYLLLTWEEAFGTSAESCLQLQLGAAAHPSSGFQPTCLVSGCWAASNTWTLEGRDATNCLANALDVNVAPEENKTGQTQNWNRSSAI